MTGSERVQAAWDELRSAMTELRDPDFTHIEGLTPAEQLEALQLLSTSHEVELDERQRKVALMAYLAIHAPGAPSIEAAIEQLSPEQLQEFNGIANGEVEQ